MIGAIIAAVGTMAMGVTQAIMGNKERKKTKKLIDDYQRQALQNQMVGIAVPQQTYNQQVQQLAQATADAYSQVGEAGARGLQMVGNIYQQEQVAQGKINAEYEESLYQQALAVAKENIAIRQMQEEREREDLEALGVRYNASENTITSGIENTVGALATLAGQIDGTRGSRASSADTISGAEEGATTDTMRGVEEDSTEVAEPDLGSAFYNRYVRSTPYKVGQ